MMCRSIKRFLYLALASLVFISFLISFAKAKGADEIYRIITEKEKINISDALEFLEAVDAESEEACALGGQLRELVSCDGIFLQKGEKKDYTAVAEYYLSNGILWGLFEYDGYAGTIGAATVEKTEVEDYLFETHPMGEFAGGQTEFTILIGKDKLYVSWGEGVCEYKLERVSEEELETRDNRTLAEKFPETEEYETLLSIVENMLGSSSAKQYSYDPATRTFTAYFAIQKGVRDAIINRNESIKNTLDSMLESFETLSEKLGTYVNLSTSEGYGDYSQGHFRLVMVDELRPQSDYEKSRDVIFEILDGTLTYYVGNAFEKSVSGNDGKRATTAYAYATIGERNALESAKGYLEIMGFSYKRLVEQLEYEGYSHSEAKYATDNCGANWNEQAVKSAKEYLAIMSFSRSGLESQLEYDGYTASQIAYAINRVYR